MTAQSETQSVSIISCDFPNIQDNQKIFKKKLHLARLTRGYTNIMSIGLYK